MNVLNLRGFSLLFVVLQCVGFTALAVHLFRIGLARKFRIFTLLCLFEPVRLAVGAWIPRGTNSYAHFYFLTEPVLWVLYVLITLEVFRNAFMEHPALYTLSRKALTVGIVLALVISVASMAIDLRNPNAPYRQLAMFLLVERTVFVSLLVFVLALIAMLAWFPVPLSRNALVHAVTFTFFFAAKTASLFTLNVKGAEFTRTVNTALLCAILLSLVSWRVLLVREEQSKLVRTGIPRDREAEQRLMRQLEELAETLAGTVNK